MSTGTTSGRTDRGAHRSVAANERLLTKVPEITAMFWVLKLISTGMGEVISDWSGQVSAALGPVFGVAGIVLALWLQMRRRDYRAEYYWFAVMMVAIFGTMAADAIHNDFGIGYAVSTPGFALITAGVFAWWYRSEGTLSIHTIDTKRRERFYWLAVLATFALGTAAGDLTAATLNLGFLDSIFLFGGIILIPAVGYWRGKMNPILAFWFAYVITRPLGASISDWISKSHSTTGLNVGNGLVSLLCFILFVPLVAWVAVTKFDVQAGHNAAPAADLGAA